MAYISGSGVRGNLTPASLKESALSLRQTQDPKHRPEWTGNRTMPNTCGIDLYASANDNHSRRHFDEPLYNRHENIGAFRLPSYGVVLGRMAPHGVKAGSSALYAAKVDADY